ncbi:hypothetical protein BC827DRAFT_1159215 [Russula dissimulans]|nr:hypothetical protein BC827DRAFT_1159215 [Russula dissimulans]
MPFQITPWLQCLSTMLFWVWLTLINQKQVLFTSSSNVTHNTWTKSWTCTQLCAWICIFQGELKGYFSVLVRAYVLKIPSPAAIAQYVDKQISDYYYTYPKAVGSSVSSVSGSKWGGGLQGSGADGCIGSNSAVCGTKGVAV